MKINKKKELAIRTLGVGKERIIFDVDRLEEIKDILTRQDIRDLVKSGAIRITEIKGRKKVKKRKRKRGPGKVKKKSKQRKQRYVKLTRGLREYVLGLKGKKEISRKEYEDLRKKIKAGLFKSKAHLKEYTKHENSKKKTA